MLTDQERDKYKSTFNQYTDESTLQACSHGNEFATIVNQIPSLSATDLIALINSCADLKLLTTDPDVISETKSALGIDSEPMVFCQEPSTRYLKLLDECDEDPRSVAGFDALHNLNQGYSPAPIDARCALGSSESLDETRISALFFQALAVI